MVEKQQTVQFNCSSTEREPRVEEMRKVANSGGLQSEGATSGRVLYGRRRFRADNKSVAWKVRERQVKISYCLMSMSLKSGKIQSWHSWKHHGTDADYLWGE